MTASALPPDDPVVEVRRLGFRYGERVALDDVSFDVAPGRRVAVLGPNGSGKSTLFRVLATLRRPTTGTCRVGGWDVVEHPRLVRTRLGVLFQDPGLDGKLTVHENLMHHGHLYGLRGDDLSSRIGDSLSRFGLLDRGRDRVDKLSGGLRRRVELAKVMLHRPDVLLLDEPTSGLDPAIRRSLFDFLDQCQAQDGITTLLTTHLMDEADRCDTVVILDHGRVVAMDSPSALKQRLGGDVVTIAADQVAAFRSRLEERFHVSSVLSDGVLHVQRERGHEFVPQLIEAFPGEINSITVGKPTLEDVFLSLTGRSIQADEERAGP